MTKDDCPRCLARGKTWPGSNPVCAFVANGPFTSENWNCATMNLLRDLGEGCVVGNAEAQQYCIVLPVPRSEGDLPDGWPDFIVLGFYKRRGRTEGAWALAETEMKPLRLEHAEAILSRAFPGERRPEP